MTNEKIPEWDSMDINNIKKLNPEWISHPLKNIDIHVEVVSKSVPKTMKIDNKDRPVFVVEVMDLAKGTMPMLVHEKYFDELELYAHVYTRKAKTRIINNVVYLDVLDCADLGFDGMTIIEEKEE